MEITTLRVTKSWKNKGEYEGTISLDDGEGQSFTFKLDDISTRMVIMCMMDRIKDTADSLAQKIKDIVEIKAEPKDEKLSE